MYFTFKYMVICFSLYTDMHISVAIELHRHLRYLYHAIPTTMDWRYFVQNKQGLIFMNFQLFYSHYFIYVAANRHDATLSLNNTASVRLLAMYQVLTQEERFK